MTENQLNLQKLATLSRLALNAEEEQHLASELRDIITMLDTLITADTSSTVPMAHPLDHAPVAAPPQVIGSDYGTTWRYKPVPFGARTPTAARLPIQPRQRQEEGILKTIDFVGLLLTFGRFF